MNDLITSLVSLCFSEFVHNALEIWGMREKVEWLRVSLDNKKHGKWPVNINTKFKTVILHVLVLLVTSGVAFLVLKALNLSEQTLIVVGIIILLVNYIFTTYKVDKFHVEIGKLIKQAKGSS
ncbi:MAG TPA: hypothetical protein VLG67_04240 [Candidatus Saccharimonadales bacterium]|nr:hypothetical protein [Candidatus Saccharimonadales bacterium]